MTPKIDTKSKISLRDAIWIGAVFLSALWGVFRLTSAVQANTRATNSMTRVIEEVVRVQLADHETRIVVMEKRHDAEDRGGG